MLRPDWRKRLRAAIDRTGKKHSFIASEAGIAAATLSHILNGRMKPGWDIAVRLAHAVGETAAELYCDEAPFELSDDEIKQVQKVVQILRDALAPTQAWEPSRPSAAPEGSVDDIPRAFLRAGARVVYTACDESMTGAGILNGDALFVKPTRNVSGASGRVVVVRINGELHVRYLDVRQRRIRLLSRNDEYPSFSLSPYDLSTLEFELIGIVVGYGGFIG